VAQLFRRVTIEKLFSVGCLMRLVWCGMFGGFVAIILVYIQFDDASANALADSSLYVLKKLLVLKIYWVIRSKPSVGP
jgi:hypothetical protein